MSYIGQEPVVGRYIKIDQISGGFNGTASGFTLAAGGQGVLPGTARNLMLSLGGVIQEPETDFTISGSGITFTTPPVSGTTFFCVVFGDMQAAGTPSDGTVLPSSISTSGTFVFPNVTVSGTTVIASGTEATPSLTISGDLNTGLYSPGADQVAISTSGTGRLFVNSDGSIDSYTGSNINIHRFAAGPGLNIRLAAGTQSSPTAITTATTLGAVRYQGYDGTTYRASASVSAVSDGAISSTSSPGSLVLATTPTGSVAPLERLRIDSTGRVGINVTSPLGFLHIETPATTAGWQLRLDSVGLANESGFYRTAADNYEMVLRNGLGGLSYLTNTGGASTATLEFNVQGSERVRIDSSGRLLVGTSTARNFNNALTTPRLQLEGLDVSQATFGLARNSANTGGPVIGFGKSRGTVTGSMTAVIAQDDLGRIQFQGADGTQLQQAAEISAHVDGTPGANDMPGRLVFSTTADGASSPTEAMRIDSGGRVLIGQPGVQQYNNFSNDLSLQISRGSNLNANIQIGSFRSDQFGGGLILSKSRSTTVGTNTVVQVNDSLGNLTFFGADGTSWVRGAAIETFVDGTPGTNDMPGRLVFSTTADGAGSTTERMRITAAGNVGIGTTSPGGLLELSSNASGTLNGETLLQRIRSNTSNGVFIDIKSRRHTAGTSWEGVGLRFQYQVDGTAMGFLEFNSLNGGQDVAIGTGGSTRLLVDSSGRVGIGTTSPGVRFDVVGQGRFDHTAVDAISVLRSGTLVGDIGGTSGGGAFSFRSATSVPITFNIATAEAARIDSSGRLLVGTSSARQNYFNLTNFGGNLQLEGTSGGGSRLASITNNSTANDPPLFVLAKSNGSSLGSNTVVAADTSLGAFSFQGNDGSEFVESAKIEALVDGTPGANDMPGRLVFSTTADGASSPTERFRITNDGVIAHDQPAPAAVNATATLTAANLKAGIITSTSAAATDMTLPTGTDTQAGFSGLTYDNFTFEWSVINTGPSLVRVLAGTAHTVVGSGSVATGTSGRFASRRTAANTFVTYRLS